MTFVTKMSAWSDEVFAALRSSIAAIIAVVFEGKVTVIFALMKKYVSLFVLHRC
jgi:hypothetical protein